jgi:UDP-2-acetamido-2,6-beta-L-arabino-hexul-4-ose reductase
MIKVGVTGVNGFIGYHLCHTLALRKEEFSLIEFQRNIFDDNEKLDAFVSECDAIVHLAALNRHMDHRVIYETNTSLVNNLVAALKRTKSKPHLIISSSIHEEMKNSYGKSKKKGRLMLSKWSNQNGGKLSGLIIPNVFGPFCKPNYNSVIATFCHQLVCGETPRIDVDARLKLIYVGDLVEEIINLILKKDNTHELFIPYKEEINVSEVLDLLQHFRLSYHDKGEIPSLLNNFEMQLFNTYRSYMDIPAYFPQTFIQYSDSRGFFVEIARHGISGQTSFSTSFSGITRGNHFHKRKFERFAVIRGKALIQLRKVGTDDVHNFYLDGDKPSYVDIPIWYTHNIKNIGDDILYTIFWINEPFNSNDTDTFFEIV